MAESATLNGRIDNVGEPAYIESGFVYSKSYENPTINDPSSATTKIVATGNGNEFSANINALTTGSNYYARAYAKSSKGVSYGSVVPFKPQSPQYVILEESHLMVMKQDLATSATWDQAVALCCNSTIGGYNDWRLPSRTEVNILATHFDDIGGLSTKVYYWSSETSYQYAYVFEFYYSGKSIYKDDYESHKEYDHRVRAVRTIP